MTSTRHVFPTTLRRATLPAIVLAAVTASAYVPADRSLLAGEVAIEAPVPAAAPQERPVEKQAPKRSDQPRERKRSEDGPPRDELLPSIRRLPA